MSSSRRTLDDTPVDRLRHRLEADRQKLLDSGVYLGEPNHSFLEDVAWQRIGRGYQLVTKEFTEAANTSTTNTDATNERTNYDATGEDNLPSLMEQVVFSAVVQISYDDCWLTPCGYWKGPNQVTKKFEDLKLTFQGERPSHEVFAQDFTTTVNNIRQLLNQQITLAGSDPKAVQRGFLSTSRANNADLLKFRHVLFEKLDGNDSDTASETEEVYTLTGWPVIHPAAENAKQEMRNTHQVVPLPAYDIKGDLIRPEKYREALAGAMVRVSFTMAHWYITSSREPTNSFVADVKKIRVLMDPVKTPSKRKTAKRDTEIDSPSPSKRRRKDGLST